MNIYNITVESENHNFSSRIKSFAPWRYEKVWKCFC